MKRRREAGQTLALVAFGMLTFLAAAGLAVDMGYLRYEKRLMQAAADSAALAAATDVNLGAAAADAVIDANAVAQAYGFPNSTVTVNNPDGAVNPPNAVQVVIQQTFPTFFMPAMGTNSSTIAVAGVATIGISQGCMYALQVGGTGLTLANPGIVINAPNCGIEDNGALTGAGTLTAAAIGVYGAYGGVATTQAPVMQMAQPAANPMAYLAPPTAPTCPGDPIAMDPVAPLNPGPYCAITITTVAAVFNPGLYTIGGTGLQITGTGTATVAGNSGVTFYITGGATVNFTGASGSIVLSAPTAAEVAGNPTFQNLPSGILFYQDSATAADVSDDGLGGSVVLNGTLYFPNAALTIASSLNPNTNTPVVAQSITVNGNGALNADTTSVPGGSLMQNVSLVQ